MAKKLQGKVALITGGSVGIGLATARQFVEEGAFVYITGRRPRELEAAVASLGANARAIQADVTRIDDLDRAYDQIRRDRDRVDIVFANAGVGEHAPLGAITEEHFDTTFGINVKGVVFTVQKALPLMPDGSAIVLNASIASLKGFSAFSIYCATKAAVRSFARTWSADLRDRRIRVNAISPGPIETDLLNRTFADPAEMKALSSTIVLGRLGRSDEVARAVVFLSSEDASFITGVELFVDGGAAQV